MPLDSEAIRRIFKRLSIQRVHEIVLPFPTRYQKGDGDTV